MFYPTPMGEVCLSYSNQTDDIEYFIVFSIAIFMVFSFVIFIGFSIPIAIFMVFSFAFLFGFAICIMGKKVYEE